jgi:hypothetical protein
MRLIGLIILLPILSFGNGGSPAPSINPIVNHYLSSFTSLEKPEQANIDVYVKTFSRLEAKRKLFTSETEFLKFVFQKIHGRFLRNFNETASFNDLTSNGRYNCLTATALYALALENLNFKYSAFETNYHIFLKIQTAEGEVLLETTDFLNGFITDSNEISGRIARYKAQNLSSSKSTKYYFRYTNSIFHQVNLNEILGLLHFNSAVSAYNNHDLQKTVEHLEQASSLYYSNRLDEFSKIIFITLLEGNCDSKTKEILLPKINLIKDHKLRSVASLR